MYTAEGGRGGVAGSGLVSSQITNPGQSHVASWSLAAT